MFTAVAAFYKIRKRRPKTKRKIMFLLPPSKQFVSFLVLFTKAELVPRTVICTGIRLFWNSFLPNTARASACSRLTIVRFVTPVGSRRRVGIFTCRRGERERKCVKLSGTKSRYFNITSPNGVTSRVTKIHVHYGALQHGPD